MGNVLAFPDADTCYGACPHCNKVSGYVTIGTVYFLTCAEHGVFWCAGEGLPWPRTGGDTLEWAASAGTLAGMRLATPVFPILLARQERAA
jgi:hypothetical protein